MLVHHSFDSRFIAIIEKLRRQYGEEMFKLEGIGEQDLDISHFSREFFRNDSPTADKSIDSNSNVEDVSVVTWEKEASKPILKLNSLYLMWKGAMDKHGIKRANKLLEAEIRGSLRVMDLVGFHKPYCWSASLQPLVHQGMPFYKKIKIGPVKHFESFINLSLQYLCYISNHLMGAVAFPDWFVYADHFVRKDYGEAWHDSEAVVRMVKQQFQSFIYSVNFNWRSSQSPFSNLTVFDRPWLEALFSEHKNPDFSAPNLNNVQHLQRMFIGEMVSNLKDNPFTFPVITAAMLYDPKEKHFIDTEFRDWIADVSKDTGLFNFYVDDKTASLASCCRLRSDLEKAKEYTNSFGVGGLSIGSHRVVALNLPQIAYESEDWTSFKKSLEHRISMCHDILEQHRAKMVELTAGGRLPLYQYGFMHLQRQFSTVGFIGLYEALELQGWDITSAEGSAKAREILDTINTMNAKQAAATGHLYNLEQIPGESAASNLAAKDSLQFEGQKYDLYSNQYIPLERDVPLAERIIAQGRFDREVGGGSILHINVDEELTQGQVVKLLEYAAEKGVVYFAINMSLSQCLSCGKTYIGRLDKSPCHDAGIRRLLRVVGYLTPVDTWGRARRDAYGKRQMYGSDALN
jgi:ribonucleoside-triphosphate reductase